MADTCRNCHFYNGDKFVGRCHRYPPVNTNGVFPSVAPETWCGEWTLVRMRNEIVRDMNAPGAALVDRMSRTK